MQIRKKVIVHEGETPAFQEMQASRLHFKIAGVSSASGCTQPPLIEV
ncbi:MAG: hypothetical protein LBP59_17655 [Planctomycetaceae bacterium]|jgi:hypothetical protein|nr:hypothetical protein [Planctomycetaceae bacterium]